MIRIISGQSYHVDFSDIDRDIDQAGVHPFNSNGKAYGFDIINARTGRVMGIVYAPSEESAEHNARQIIEQGGGMVTIQEEDSHGD